MSSRPVTLLVIFFVSFNAMAGIYQQQGVDDTLGVDTRVGEDETFQEVQNNTTDIRTGTSLGNTLFGMYNTLLNGVQGIFRAVFPGLVMLERAGMPWWLTKGLLAPVFSILVFVAAASYIRGFSL